MKYGLKFAINRFLLYFILKFIIFLGNLGILAIGMCLGWTSPSLPKLKDLDQTPLKDTIDDNQESWIASLIALGAAISSYNVS